MRLTLLRGILILFLINHFIFFSHHNSQANHSLYSSEDSYFDWRDHGYDFPVKDQGVCNAGYAFAAVDAVQAAIWKKDSIKLDFSENHAKECNWHAINHYAGFPNTCEGGNFRMLINLFTQEGLVVESCDPYVDYDDSCSTRCVEEDDTECIPKCSTLYYVTEWQQFSSSFDTTSTVLIKQKLIEHGPLYTQMDPKISGFSSYAGGYVLSGTSTDPNKWTHGVLIVGWDDELSYPGGKGAWIVKNSYGTEWGNGGYFAIAYGKAGIGSSLATVTGWERNTIFNKIHFYDEAGHTNQMFTSGTSPNAKVMTIFGSTQNELGRAIEFWTTSSAIVNVIIYDNFEINIFTEKLFESRNNLIPFAGYYGIDIFPSLEIIGDDDIYVIVEIMNFGSSPPLVFDHLSNKFDGQNSIFDNVSNWLPLGKDAGIRLRTFPWHDGFTQKIFLPILLH